MGLAQLLDKRLTLQRQTPTAGTIGGQRPGAFADVIANVPCAKWPASADTKNDFARRDLVAAYEICTASDLNAQSGDRIQIGAATYPVVGQKEFSNAAFSSEGVFITVVSERNQ